MPAGVHFIPGHPLAGTENSGPDAGFADLFENRWCIFTPLPDTDPAALEKLSEFWRRCGSNIDTMDPEHHDKVLAIVSHLPHIIAYNIVGTADDLEAVTEVRSDQIFGLRLSRFHAPCRLRPDHVARRLPAQQGRDPRNAGAVFGRSRLAAAGDPLGRRRQAVRPVHPHPRRAPLDHRGRPGNRRARLRPPGDRASEARRPPGIEHPAISAAEFRPAE